jgi:hypothetical protein
MLPIPATFVVGAKARFVDPGFAPPRRGRGIERGEGRAIAGTPQIGPNVFTLRGQIWNIS